MEFLVSLNTFPGSGQLRDMTMAELTELAAECRRTIIEQVSRNGGHLASNLGCVELTLALHRVFDIKKSPIIFDVGHQCYTHKLLTGRSGAFQKLRQSDGCSGFPSPAESEWDAAVGGHAGTALSTALGIGAARELEGNSDKVIAVVGDGACSNGITFEALNTCKAGGKNLLFILNDNEMSISPAVGALSAQLSKIISGRFYNKTRSVVRRNVKSRPGLHRFFRYIDDRLKSLLLPPSALFQSFGFRFFGPVDGHSLPELIAMLEKIKDLEGPLLLHVVTRKGKGAYYAENAPEIYHGVGKFTAENGTLVPSSEGFSAVFGSWMCRKAEQDERLIAVSAAMIPGVGLSGFAKKFPKRCFDTGIAEEHASVFASGMALAGKKAVCALYATFAQRALDCIYHDAVLGKVPVIFVFDRAGVVPDGPTHHGIYDLGFLRSLPGLVVMMPRNGRELEMMLDQALEINGPVVIRYPRGGSREKALPEPRALEIGKSELLQNAPDGPVIWALGAECGIAEKVVEILENENISSTLINIRYVVPFDSEKALKFASRLQVVIEDHGTGGAGSALAEILSGIPGSRLAVFNWGNEIVGHGNVDTLRRKNHLTPEDIAGEIMKILS